MVTAKCGAAANGAGATLSLASALSSLNAASAGVSVEPSEYSWGAPSLLQQQALYSQFLQLAFMCAVPPYAHLGVCPPARPTLFPTFMTPFAGAMPSAPSPAPSPSPSPVPSPPASQQTSAPAPQAPKPPAARPEATTVKAAKAAAHSKKAGSKARPGKAGAAGCAVPAPGGAPKLADDMELDDICKLLGDDAFLEHLQDDVLSEGSNGSSATSDGRALAKQGSGGSLSAGGSHNNNDGGHFAGNNFASTFDLDVHEAPAPAAAPDCSAWPAAQAPAKAASGDLNNLVASSPTRSTRSSRTAAREAAATAAGATAAPAATKITLKVKGGVQKAGAKASKAQPAGAATPAAPAQGGAAAGSADEHLTAADLSRLLGEDDDRIPDGWDLDLDFENPFSCSITAF